MDKFLTGKVALVTGGSSGIGKATAILFTHEGAKVAITSRNQTAGETAVRQIQEVGGEAIWIQADVSQASQVRTMMEKVIASYGRLDYAFNNAGSGGKGGWAHEIDESDWDLTVDGFLKSTWLCMKYEIPEILKVGGGVIINNSSVDGERAFPWDPVYSAAKHGVLGLTKSTAVQYANRGLRINAVCPSWIRTPPVDEMISRDPEAEGRLLQHQPIGRLGTPEEVAQVVVWLCSEKASFVLGTSMAVDGGYLAV